MKTREQKFDKLSKMKAYYKNNLIEKCEGSVYIPNYKCPKYQIISLDDCDEVIRYCNTLKEAKEIIDLKSN